MEERKESAKNIYAQPMGTDDSVVMATGTGRWALGEGGQNGHFCNSANNKNKDIKKIPKYSRI